VLDWGNERGLGWDVVGKKGVLIVPVSLRSDGDHVITGSDDLYHGLIHYILYERIAGLLSFSEFIAMHERVVDLPVTVLFAGVDKGD
jgi:hypothetical protein